MANATAQMHDVPIFLHHSPMSWPYFGGISASQMDCHSCFYLPHLLVSGPPRCVHCSASLRAGWPPGKPGNWCNLEFCSVSGAGKIDVAKPWKPDMDMDLLLNCLPWASIPVVILGIMMAPKADLTYWRLTKWDDPSSSGTTTEPLVRNFMDNFKGHFAGNHGFQQKLEESLGGNCYRKPMAPGKTSEESCHQGLRNRM